MYSKASSGACIISNLKSFKINKSETVDDYQSKNFNCFFLICSETPFKVRKSLSISCGRLIPKDLIKEIKFNEKIRRGEDSLFMAEISKNIEVYKFTEESCIYYRRIRKGSASRKKIKTLTLKKELLVLIYIYILSYSLKEIIIEYLFYLEFLHN